MGENLKELSDAAVPGPWRHVVGDDYYIESDSYPKRPTHYPGVEDTGDWCVLIGNRPKDFGDSTSRFIVALVNAYRDGRLVERDP